MALGAHSPKRQAQPRGRVHKGMPVLTVLLLSLTLQCHAENGTRAASLRGTRAGAVPSPQDALLRRKLLAKRPSARPKSRQQVSQRATEIFLAHLKLKAPAYSNFATIIESTGFKGVLEGILQKFSVTVLVPVDTKTPLSAAGSKYIAQRLGFHLLVGRWEADQLTRLKPGAQLLTLDCYPRTLNVYAYRAKGTPATFDNLPAGTGDAKIVLPNFFVTDRLIAHGISNFMEPYRNFG